MLKKLAAVPLMALMLVGAGCPADTYVNGNISVNSPDAETPTACTLEARLCPDGSYVGRVPPSCEFAPCPAVSANVNESVNGNSTIEGGTNAPIYP